ncbi:lysine--tRNA ligase, partial [Candidatus Wolfebacteria bacterium]|nr:lysine--tRNA ligase [Candidatus Wolfebacteria bacterium]
MLDDILKERQRKLKNFIDADINPFPSKIKRTFFISEALKNFAKFSSSKKQVFIVGRIISLRDQGNLVFLDIKDESGKIQLVFKRDNLKNFKILKQNLDIGDFLSVWGPLFKTQKGEKSVEVKSAEIIAKSMRPLPAHWYGLEDVETRLRKKYLDILTHPEVKDIFVKKNIFWQTIRGYLQKEGFLEVETPILEATPGGAEAEPFKTHHNALNTDFYLRISLEIALKKLLVAGYEKVFEIGRIFRNEGIDAEHLQDYTQLEFYWAYENQDTLMKFTEKMYKEVIKKTCGGLKTKWNSKTINWGKKWGSVDYFKIFKEKVGLDLNKATRDELFKKAKTGGLNADSILGRGRLIDLLYKKFVRPTLIQPVFLVNQPAEIEPLAKRSEQNPNIVYRFQIVACGSELGKGFSEANDPIDQRERFEEQMKLRAKGDKEAQILDED